MPGDLFRSVTWSMVRASGVECVGGREIQHVLEREPEEFLDLEQDPMETTNRIGDPGLQEVVTETRQKLTDFQRATRDPWLEVNFQEGPTDDPQNS